MKMLFVPLLKCVFCAAAVDQSVNERKNSSNTAEMWVWLRVSVSAASLKKQKNRIEKQQNQRSESFCAPKMILPLSSSLFQSWSL